MATDTVAVPSKLSEYMKSLAPALAAIAMTLATAVNLGELDLPAIETGLVGLAAAGVALVVKNGAVGISRYMKALAPALLTLIGVGIHALVTGDFNPAEARIAASGLIASFITLIVPNVTIPPQLARAR